MHMKRKIFFTTPTPRTNFHLLGAIAPLLRMHGLEQVVTALNFGFLSVKWGLVSGQNEAGFVGTHLVAPSVARMLRTKLNWCFQHTVPSHVGGEAQKLGSSPACRQLQAACYLPRSSLLPQGIPPSCHIRDWDAVLQPGHSPANGSRNLWTTASTPPLPYWTQNWCWRARRHPWGAAQVSWRLDQASLPSFGCSLAGGGTQAYSLCRDTRHMSQPHPPHPCSLPQNWEVAKGGLRWLLPF